MKVAFLQDSGFVSANNANFCFQSAFIPTSKDVFDTSYSTSRYVWKSIDGCVHDATNGYDDMLLMYSKRKKQSLQL